MIVETIDHRHGRRERHRITVSDGLVDYNAGPGVQQVFRPERETVPRATGELGAEAAPDRLLRLTRHHWCIENRSHWVRDVPFDEDLAQVRCESNPEIRVPYFNGAMCLLKVPGEPKIAAAWRRFAACPRASLAVFGIAMNN